MIEHKLDKGIMTTKLECSAVATLNCIGTFSRIPYTKHTLYLNGVARKTDLQQTIYFELFV